MMYNNRLRVVLIVLFLFLVGLYFYPRYVALTEYVQADGIADVILTGVIVDKDTGQPIDDVSVERGESGIGVNDFEEVRPSDANGVFRVKARIGSHYEGRSYQTYFGTAKVSLHPGSLRFQKEDYVMHEISFPAVEDTRKSRFDIPVIKLGTVEMSRVWNATESQILGAQCPP